MTFTQLRHKYRFEYQLYDVETGTVQTLTHIEEAYTAEDARTQARVNVEEQDNYKLNGIVVTLRSMRPH